MKISNSKKELALIISENGGWRNGEFAAQDGDGSVGGYDVKPEWSSLAKYWWREAWGEWFLANKIKNHHQTVLSRAEYFHLYPAPDADGWIEWKGGKCPVDGDVNVKFWSGTIKENPISARELYWEHDGDISDIIAYRLHKHEKVKSEFCESVMRSIPEPTAKPTIEQLAAYYRNKLDYANRKQDEANKANMESDAALSQLEDAIAKIGFAITPLVVTEKEPELVITDWRDLQVGDEIEMLGDGWNCDNVGKIGVVRIVEGAGYNGDLAILCDIGEEGSDWGLGFKFIRRP